MSYLKTSIVLLLLLLFAGMNQAQTKHEIFNSFFPDIQLIDTAYLDFDFTEASFHKYMVDSIYDIPSEIGDSILPDSLMELEVPVWKLKLDSFHFYFVVSTVSNWNWGYLLVREADQGPFVHTELTFASEPADSGEHFKKSKLYKKEGQLMLLIIASDQSNQHYERNCFIYHETTSKLELRWEPEKKQFVPVQESIHTERIYYDCSN